MDTRSTIEPCAAGLPTNPATQPGEAQAEPGAFQPEETMPEGDFIDTPIEDCYELPIKVIRLLKKLTVVTVRGLTMLPKWYFTDRGMSQLDIAKVEAFLFCHDLKFATQTDAINFGLLLEKVRRYEALIGKLRRCFFEIDE